MADTLDGCVALIVATGSPPAADLPTDDRQREP